jgi:nucleotide-binding universal stress UspA family protein
MKPIVVATDFSPASLNAAIYSAEMALSIGAELWLLHVYEYPVSYSEIPLAVDPAKMQEDADLEMESFKERLLFKMKDKPTVFTETRMGTLYPELKEFCERVNPYAVVMGTKSASPAEHFLFRSNTAYAMKHLPWPLLAVPENCSYSAIKKIGLACDFAKIVHSVPIDEIKSLVSQFKAELHVINTGRKDVFNPEIVFESGLLEKLLEPVKPVYHFISGENTDDGILRFAEENDINLLVILPKRHGLLERIFQKNHTKEFVLHTHVPLVALHQ